MLGDIWYDGILYSSDKFITSLWLNGIVILRYWVRQEPTQVKRLSSAPLYGRTTNVRLSWKGLPGTNTLAFYEN
jgi:hypothetical protein